MIVSQKNGTHPYTVIDGVITNATRDGLFIKTASKIDNDKLFFTYRDQKSKATLYFDCNVLRTDPNGIAVTYTLLSDSDQEQAACLYKWNPKSFNKGRFLDCYI
jgi:hypothetical protein